MTAEKQRRGAAARRRCGAAGARLGLPQKCVDQRGLAVVHVRDDGDVTHIVAGHGIQLGRRRRCAGG